MLYVTTRNSRDAYTAHRALLENRGPDGGLYLPFRPPAFSQEELDGLLAAPFCVCLARVLNLLFNTKLQSWDVEATLGRQPVRLKQLGARITVAETWHNPQWSYEGLTRKLMQLLSGGTQEQPGNWTRIALRTAVLFAVFGELKRAGVEERVDVALVCGDFSAPISAWYARQWGLPVGNIVCCCNENDAAWDLLCQGQLRTDAVSVPTATREADVALPVDLERLICGCGGPGEVERYLDACRAGRMYCPNDLVLERLRQGLYVSVVSSRRMASTVPSVWRTHQYLLSPYSALSYAGLLDYRAKAGKTRRALILAERSPVQDAAVLADILGISAQEVETLCAM